MSAALLVVAGWLYSLSQPNFFFEGSPSAACLGFSLFIWVSLFRLESLSHRLLGALLFCFCINALSFHWIIQTLQEFGELPFWLAFILWLLFTVLIFPHYFLFVAIAHWIWTGSKNLEFNHWFKKYPFVGLTVLAACMTFIEANTPLQFPAFIGHSFITWPSLSQLASLFGASLYSFFCFFTSLFLVWFWHNRRPHHLGALLLVFLPLVVSFFYDRHLQQNQRAQSKTIAVRVVQANIGNVVKIASESGDINSIEKVLALYQDLSTRPYLAAPTQAPELIVWPETAYPYAMRSRLLRQTTLLTPPVFKSVLRETNAELAVGSYDEAKEGLYSSEYEDTYNSVFYFESSGKLKNIYHKFKLLPFGETLPFGPFNEALSGLIPNISFFAKGERWSVLNHRSGANFIAPICYEVLYTDFIRRYINNAEKPVHAILNVTNDSWFGGGLEPRQHLFLAQWRSIEFRLPMIRATNTGITAWIDSSGRIREKTNYGQPTNLDFLFPFGDAPRPSLYQRFGGWILCGFIAIFGLLAFGMEKLLVRPRKL